MRFSIYILDRANQIKQEAYPTKAEADEAYDRWEAAGHDVYTERLAAILEKDAYDLKDKK
jgi:hypothetical protein